MPQFYKKTSIRFPQTLVFCRGSRKSEYLFTGPVGFMFGVFFLDDRMINLLRSPNGEPGWAFDPVADLALDLGVADPLALAGVFDFYEEGQRGEVS